MSSPSRLVNLAKSTRLRSVLPNNQYKNPHPHLTRPDKLTGQELQEHELPQLQSFPHLQDPAELHPQSEPGMMKVVCGGDKSEKIESFEDWFEDLKCDVL